jgi:phosphoglycerate dehydrogenase-like enzyme
MDQKQGREFVVYWPSPPPAEALALLRERLAPAIRLVAGPDTAMPAGTRVLVAGRPGEAELRASPELSAVVIPWAGVPEPTRELLGRFPHLALHNLHHNAAPVAELAFALLLAVAKLIVPVDRKLRAGDWRPRYERGATLLLEGKRALVLGYGHIGRRAGRLCRAMGMEVWAIQRRPQAAADETASQIHPVDRLPDLLPQVQALLVCLPLTPETRGLIGARELALLPANGVLVNIGRGPIIDEKALYEALCDRRLLGAGLDVWYNYPDDEAGRANTQPSDYPFHELDNVVMSPHRGGDSDETERLRLEQLGLLLNELAAGRPGPNRVELAAGY